MPRSTFARQIASTLGIWVIAASYCSAQGAAPPTLAPTVIAPQSQVPINFDVASIRLDKSGKASGTIMMRPDGDTLIVTNAPLSKLVAFAYDFRRDDLTFGTPGWAAVDRYDVTARVAPSDIATYHALSTPQRKAMVQRLLADRCQLIAHMETKDVPVYALMLAKHGPKMEEAKPGAIAPIVTDATGKATQEDAISRMPGEIRGQQVPMTALALALSASDIGRQVLDRTGLTGRYSFNLQWTPERTSGPGSSGSNGASDDGENSPRPSIFTAVQEQLGLRLEPTRAPVQVLVIDQLNRPSEN